ncbi:MAG: signal peptidase [Thermoguttaceae bacterium]|nr:signal peptidase [Thermoguttaceae bacterium]
MPEYIVRYGAMRIVGIFTAPAKSEYKHNEYVIARTERGMETAQVLSLMRPEYQKTMEELAKLNKLGTPPHGKIVRPINEEDLKELDRIHDLEIQEFEKTQVFIRQKQLDMHLVDIEHIFGGERIVVYYLADGRIDFRELVKILAAEFQTRIEMRQIGVRDEAKLLADFGDCGKEVCCNSFLTIMPSVSMKMAKMQKATLDPSKISGRCGRLKCCLRYEFDTYEEMQGKMPSLGTFVSTPDGDGKVVGHEFLAEKVQVEMSDFQIVSYPITDIKVIHEAFDQRELRYTGEQADAAQLEQLDDKRETRGERRDKRKAPQKNIPQVQPRKSQTDDSKGSNKSNDSNDSFGAGILE